jgi:orc1/cdc6 family replication initiation protein
MFEDVQNRIIRNAQALTTDFIPSRVYSRDGQLQAMRDDMRPLLKGLTSRHAFLFGRPGTGKTCLARYVADELAKHTSSVASIYINCWESTSRFKVLYTILQRMGYVLSVHRKGTPTDELMDTLRNKLKERQAVIILDEVDQLDDDKILYDLISLPRTCLILISNNENALANVDQRVRSRLAAADHVEFPEYKTSEIAGILKDRVDWGLLPAVIKGAQVGMIAEAASGDARVAIDILRIVAESAENQDLERIPDELIKDSLPKAQVARKDESMTRLNPYQRAIIEILTSNGRTDSGTLFRELQAIGKRQGLEPIVDRTFRKYMDKMLRYNMVESEGSGRWRTYRLS